MTEPYTAPHHIRYCGRYAPSPTGPLHFGSLVAVVGSYLQARVNHGVWRVRMEDLDPPREIPGAADAILRSLERFGLQWDGVVLYQSQRLAAYALVFETLQHRGSIYPCACSRREIADSSVTGIDGPLYPGTCRNGLPADRGPRDWRVRTDDQLIAFDDGLQGRIESHLAQDSGDFVVKRADGFYAYQLAVVADDAAQGITEVVRGCDLLDSTPRQIHLQRLLSLPTPAYLHLPVAVNARGEKLSKQTFAAPLDQAPTVAVLHAALQFLGQNPPVEARTDTLDSLWNWATAHWQAQNIPRLRTATLPA